MDRMLGVAPGRASCIRGPSRGAFSPLAGCTRALYGRGGDPRPVGRGGWGRADGQRASRRGGAGGDRGREGALQGVGDGGVSGAWRGRGVHANTIALRRARGGSAGGSVAAIRGSRCRSRQVRAQRSLAGLLHGPHHAYPTHIDFGFPVGHCACCRFRGSTRNAADARPTIPAGISPMGPIAGYAS